MASMRHEAAAIAITIAFIVPATAVIVVVVAVVVVTTAAAAAPSFASFK